MIPEEKSAAVAHALQQTFGVTEPEDISDLTERPGSNRVFRIVVHGSAYLLRINTRPGDMARQFGCMKMAADAGLAPRVPLHQHRGPDFHHRFCHSGAATPARCVNSTSVRLAFVARASAVS